MLQDITGCCGKGDNVAITITITTITAAITASIITATPLLCS